MLIPASAIICAILVGAVVVFQLCLALGAPWGVASMGGKFPGKYPSKMRIVALINMVVLCFVGCSVLIKANMMLPQFKAFSNTAIYFVVGFFAIAVVLNTITSSKIERTIWAPVTTVQLITSVIVAFF